MPAREQGYSLKWKCSESVQGAHRGFLLAAAASAEVRDVHDCVQDHEFVPWPVVPLHSASLAPARILTVAAIEGNGRQYCPAARTSSRLVVSGMFEIKHGTVETGLSTSKGPRAGGY